MKITFITSKIENQFFFISNLSEWHFSCRKDYNKEWLSSKKLSPTEQSILYKTKKILQSHGYQHKNGKNQYIGQAFYIPSEHKKWHAVKSVLSAQEYKILSESFLYFDNRFENIWKPTLLKAWSDALKNECKKPAIKKLFSSIEKFYGISLPATLNVHLIASPSKKRSAAGSANIGSTDIVLEVPVFNKKQWYIESSIAIIAHELIHILIDQSKKIQSYTKKIKKELSSKKHSYFDRSTSELTKEILGELCAPFGYPCQKTFVLFKPLEDIVLPNLINKKNNTTHTFIKRVLWHLYPDVGYYIEKEKAIDANLTRRIINWLEESIKLTHK